MARPIVPAAYSVDAANECDVKERRVKKKKNRLEGRNGRTRDGGRKVQRKRERGRGRCARVCQGGHSFLLIQRFGDDGMQERVPASLFFFSSSLFCFFPARV